MLCHFKSAALAAAVLCSFNAFAAETIMPLVVVTASRQAQRINELTADVTVLDKEDIERAGQSTLTQLLARQSGLQMVSNGGPGANSSIFIRGANASHTLVLIDGMRVNSATAGATALENIPLAEIDHVEILRGPGAALYGSDAIGGVIQIFTRRGAETPRLDAFAGFGGYNTQQADVGYSGVSGDFSYNLRAGKYSTDGFSATNDPKKQPFSYNPDKDGFDQQHVGVNLAMKLRDKDEMGLNLLQVEGKNQYDNGLTRFDDRISKKLDTYQAYLRNSLLPNWTSTLRVGRGTDDSKTIGKTKNSVFRTDQDQFQWQNDVEMPLGRALLAYEYVDQQVSGTTKYAVGKRDIRSLMAGWNGNVEGHRVQINLRHDDNSQFGGKTTGLASYGYQFTSQWRAYVSAGTAFRAPSFNELYFPGFGNPKLQPELANNREIGIAWDGATQNASVTLYDNHVTNLINTVCDVFFNCKPVNIGKAELEGATFSYATNAYGFNLTGSVDVLNARDQITGKRLNRRANEQGNLQASYTIGPWVLGGELNASGLRYDNAANTNRMGGYTVLNAFAHYRLAPEWNVEVRGNNLGDRRYETARGFAVPGANLFVALRYTQK